MGIPREVAVLLTKEETQCLVKNLCEHKKVALNLSKLTQSQLEGNKESILRSNGKGMKAEDDKEGKKKRNLSNDEDGKNTEEDKEEDKKSYLKNNDGSKNTEEDVEMNKESTPRNLGNWENADEGKDGVSKNIQAFLD